MQDHLFQQIQASLEAHGMLASARYHLSIDRELVSFEQFYSDFVHAADCTVIEFDRLRQNILHSAAELLLLILSRLMIDLNEELNEDFGGDG